MERKKAYKEQIHMTEEEKAATTDLREDMRGDVEAHRGYKKAQENLERTLRSGPDNDETLHITAINSQRQWRVLAKNLEALCGDEIASVMSNMHEVLRNDIIAWNGRVHELWHKAETVKGAAIFSMYADVSDAYDLCVAQKDLYFAKDALLTVIDKAKEMLESDWVRELAENEEAQKLISNLEKKICNSQGCLSKYKVFGNKVESDKERDRVVTQTKYILESAKMLEDETKSAEETLRKIYLRFAEGIRKIWDTIQPAVPACATTGKPLEQILEKDTSYNYADIPTEGTATITFAMIDEYMQAYKDAREIPMRKLDIPSLREAGLVAQDTERVVILDTGYTVKHFRDWMRAKQVCSTGKDVYIDTGFSFRKVWYEVNQKKGETK